MVSNLPPIQPPLPPSSGLNPSENPEENPQEIILEMEQFLKELRADIGPPQDVKALKKLLVKMENFLKSNKKEIYKIMEKQGYPVKGPFSISSEFNTAISTIQTYLKDPNDGSIDLLNEAITQMHYYMTHHDRPA